MVYISDSVPVDICFSCSRIELGYKPEVGTVAHMSDWCRCFLQELIILLGGVYL